jgi:hypothetical protein
VPIKPNSFTRIPGKFYTTVYYDGDFLPGEIKPDPVTTIVDSTSELTIRTVTGSSRHKPKPLTPAAYGINYQRQRAENSFHYIENVGSNKFKHTYGGGPGLAPSLGGYSLLNPSPSDWYAITYNKALDNLNDNVRGSLDLSVDIAQAGQTAKMLRVKDSLVSYVRNFVSNRSKFKALIQGISNARLEFIYGWKPLVEDLYLAADESVRVPLNVMGRFQGHSSQKLSFSHIQMQTVYGVVNFPVSSQDAKVSIKIGVQLYTPSFDLSRWASLNPVSIAWEIIPYSFVVDWVFNIGGYLRNLETGLLSQNRFRNGYITQFFRGNVVGRLDNGSSFWTVNGQNIDMNRSVLSSYPLPSLPRFSVELGSSRLLNAAALLGQLLKR